MHILSTPVHRNPKSAAVTGLPFPDRPRVPGMVSSIQTFGSHRNALGERLRDRLRYGYVDPTGSLEWIPFGFGRTAHVATSPTTVRAITEAFTSAPFVSRRSTSRTPASG